VTLAVCSASGDSMPLQGAEHFFRKGMACLSDHRPGEAARHFLTAMQLERNQGVRRSEMRYLSYFGFASALAGGSLKEAVAACETAVGRQPGNPDLHANLARVHVLAGDLPSALRAAGAGLAIDPEHRELQSLLRAGERRRRPPLRFLPRNHPVNRVLGRLRASLGTQEKAPPARSERGLPPLS